MWNPCLTKFALLLQLLVCNLHVFLGAVRGADYRIYLVEPAVTDHMILKNGPLPPVCKEGNQLTVYACRGEYEPASFVVTAAKPLGAVNIEVDPMEGPGRAWPSTTVDVRVVKEVFRWTLANGASPMPTLLVHDDNFLVMNPPPPIDEIWDNDKHGWIRHVTKDRLQDASDFRSVDVQRRKQFWITVHVPEDAPAGTYRTKVRVVPTNSVAAELTLTVQVYPFDLLDPMLEYSIYYPVTLVEEGAEDWLAGKWKNTAWVRPAQYLAECKNMVQHGLTNPNIYGGPRVRRDGSLDFTHLAKILDLREQAGMRPKVLYLLGHPLLFTDRPLELQEREMNHRYVREINNWVQARGYDEVFFAAADEWKGKRLSAERDSMESVREAGGKIFVAVIGPEYFERVGDIIDLPILSSKTRTRLSAYAEEQYSAAESLHHMSEIASAGSFERMRRADYRTTIHAVHRLDRKIYTYMNPLAGQPLPQLQRRNEGLGLWRVGFDGTMTWAYTHISSGDPLNQRFGYAKVYRTEDGVVDTLHWEGSREGVDDVRYLTTLLDKLVRLAGSSLDREIITETYRWLSRLDISGGDLDGIRREIARRTIRLMNFDAPPSCEEILSDIDVTKIKVVTFPEPWRFKIDPDNQGVSERYFDPSYDDSDWTQIRTDQEIGWDQQGFPGTPGESLRTHGWYRSLLPLSEEDRSRQFKYLYFDNVDEQGWIYLDGHLIFRHTVDSTGMPASQLRITPFSVSLSDIESGVKNVLVARVYSVTRPAGILSPVRVVLSDEPLEAEQIAALCR